MFSYRWLLLLIGIQNTLILDASTQDLWHQHDEHYKETTTGASTRIRLSNGYFKVSENDQWRVEQHSGKPISGEIFDAVGDFQENMLPVKKNNLWGFLHSSGKLVIDFEYEHISPFIHNISISRKENAWYLINALDRSTKKLAIDYYSGREKNRLVVYKNGKKGYLDLNGKLLAPGWMEANLTTPVHRTNSSLQVNNNTCPPNVNFEEGLFNQWECFNGFVQAQGNQNVITMSPNTPVPADPNRHLIIPRTTPAALDFYGNFPVNPPDGSNFAVKLGNIQVGAEAERIRYRIDVPTGAQQFFVVFQYAVVYEEPVNGQPHTPWEHPRFTARLFDPSTNSADLCANFDFNSSDATGFQTSPILSSRGEPVLYKPWQSVFVNLTKYAGRTVYLEFTTADCTRTGHWGYAYVDVDDCDLNIVAQNSCLNNSTVLKGPTGFSNIKWWNNNFTVKYGEGNSLNINPALAPNTAVKIELTPFSGNACKDTASVIIASQQLRVELGNDKNVCAGDSIFIGLTPKPNLSYQWTSAPTLSATNIANPKAFPLVTTKYYLRITDTETGCTARDSISVNIRPKPILTVNSPSICPGQSAQLNASGANQYAWTPHPTLNTLTGASVTVSPATTTSYSVTGRNTSTGCENTTSTSVTVNPLPTGGISINGNNQFICDGYSVALIGTGGDTYQWYLNNAAIPGATSSTYQATRNGTYALELTSAFGCKNFVTSRPAFTVLTKPKADFRPPSGCIGNTLSFTNLSQSGQSGPVIYQWNFGDNSGSDLQNPQHTYLNKGAYSASLKVIPTTCPMLYDSSSSLVIIEAPVPGIRYPTVNTLINSSTTLRARTFGINYLWQPSVGLNNPLIVAPIFNDDEENDYIIRITNAYGCVTYDSVKVRIFGFSDIQVPTAFSPNGDGHNDKLDVFLIGIKELTFFKVFNRWGQLMFETNDRLQLWDGRFRDKDQPLETYVWIAQGIGIDGKKITKRGQTVLIR